MPCHQRALLCFVSSTVGYWSLLHWFPSRSVCLWVCTPLVSLVPDGEAEERFQEELQQHFLAVGERVQWQW